jgi:mono/diheme cytochrome c family protein
MSCFNSRNCFSGALLAMVLFASCTKNPNTPGVEYMPDMYRSPAIEAYVDYGMDPYLVGEEKAAQQRSTQSARKPVAGTIANYGEGSPELYMPYPYPNTVEGYEKAGVELKVPIPMDKANFEKGAAVFTRFCIHCHGEKGEGNGSMTETAGGKYPVVPSYQSRADLPYGKMYHSIMYGKGLMGSHASQLSPLERWQVILYVKSLMKGEPKFDANANIISFGEAAASSSAPQSPDNAQLTQN